ncbi:MAG: putative ABC transporter permease [Lachnospiraceae bacterium]|nr:putative ABC transporter permease [Lachnospiraceae bacterium]
MTYNGYELAWLFLVYSFLGWVLETIMAALKKRRFVNRGVINAPLCISYGIPMVLITVFGEELSWFWLFCGATVVTAMTEWIGGRAVEYFYHERWWDYSNVKWNLDGYICLPVTLMWGTLATVCMLWGNALLIVPFRVLPELAEVLVIWICVVAVLLDALATLTLMYGRSAHAERWRTVDNWFTSLSRNLGGRLYRQVTRRIERAYPQKKAVEKKEVREAGVFASGCSPYKLIWKFILGAILGDLFEIVFMRITTGVWMSRTSLVWGQFSIIWGFAIAAATRLLYPYRDRSDSFIFLTGTVLGAVYEYLCSVLSEMIFGTVFWDYSEIPFNLGGRINLLYCLFWGMAAVLWLRVLYPRLSGLVEKIPMRGGKILTWCMVVFLICNMLVSGMALLRSNERLEDVEATQGWQVWLDTYYDDDTLAKIYPNAIRVE